MTSSPTKTDQTSASFEMEWPGCHRWAVLMDRFREHFYGVEEWWAVKLETGGELGISAYPKAVTMDDYTRPRQSRERDGSVGFSNGWTLLAG